MSSAIADHVVDMGPGAGSNGGTVVYEGDVDGLVASGTATGRHMDVRQTMKRSPGRRAARFPSATRGCTTSRTFRSTPARRPDRGHRRRRVGQELADPRLPAAHRPTRDLIDQSAIRGSRRSNPATYTGHPRPDPEGFAKANGVKPALFSANSEGACPACNGLGMIYTDPGLHGRRSRASARCARARDSPTRCSATPARQEHRRRAGDVRGRGSRVLHREARRARCCDRLADVGLGYITLGQQLDTLSGGERQRLKLAIEMSGATEVYVLDEPTTGLHMQDVDNLIGLLDRLVERGTTVIVIEHNLDVVARADWVIDMGPGAGHDGGRVIFEGPPAELIKSEASLTGLHLKRRLDS